jgi:flagellar biosynthesis protein FlhF
MRLKAYTAATMAEAMQQIRDELGDEAAIVATESNGSGVRVLAALEEESPPPQRPTPAPAERAPLADFAAKPKPRSPGPSPARSPDSAAQALAYHSVPEPLIDSLTGAASPGARATLAERLDRMFQFANLADRRETAPILLAGPPGAGKTLTAAKLAARSVLAGRSVRVITTDTGSAGAVEQLSTFTRPLRIELETADGPAQLAARLGASPQLADRKPLVIIDTAGINPFDAVELAGLSALIVASRADPVLVLAAGGDARESAEIAETFARIGCARLLATRLDLARRLGGLLTAALAGRLAFAETGSSPIIANGLQPLNAQTLARLLGVDGKTVELHS